MKIVHFMVSVKSISKYVQNNTVRGVTRGRMFISEFALLNYRMTNQIYLSVTRKSSSANETNLLAKVAAACLPGKSDSSLCNQAVQII